MASWLIEQLYSDNAEVAVAVLAIHERMLGKQLGQALDDKEWDAAGAIASALSAFWSLTGQETETDGWVDRAATYLDNDRSQSNFTAPGPGQIWMTLAIAQANDRLGRRRLGEAENTYLRVVSALETQQPSAARDETLAVGYHQLGRVAQDRGELDQAERWYLKSLEISERLGDQSGIAGSYHQLGRVAQDRRQLDQAERWYLTSLEISERLGNQSTMASSYHQLGMVAQDRGQLDRAEQWYHKSLQIEQQLGNQSRMATSYHQLGILTQDRAQLDQAERWYLKSLQIQERLGDESGRAGSYHQLGIVAQDRGRLDQAERWYLKSLEIAERLGIRSGMATNYGQLGLLAEARGQPSQALGWTVRCVTLFDRFPHPAFGPAAHHLARLTGELGLPALEHAWQEVTGEPLPDAVRAFVTEELNPKGRP